jgi:hypothetical protein
MTETTQPDPQVVAWMRAYRGPPGDHRPQRRPDWRRREYRNAHLAPRRHDASELRALVDASTPSPPASP